MIPIDLPWWGWLAGGAGGIVIGLMLISGKDNWFTNTLGWLVAAAGGVSAFIGVSHYMHWVWMR
jgi:hypothetical protein